MRLNKDMHTWGVEAFRVCWGGDACSTKNHPQTHRQDRSHQWPSSALIPGDIPISSEEHDSDTSIQWLKHKQRYSCVIYCQQVWQWIQKTSYPSPKMSVRLGGLLCTVCTLTVNSMPRQSGAWLPFCCNTSTCNVNSLADQCALKK